MKRTECPVCGMVGMKRIIEQRNVACQDGVLWNSKTEALEAPQGSIELVFCRHCLYIGNDQYDPSLVQFKEYDISLQHSPSFQRFTGNLAERLIERYDIKGKTILEIGCGKGEFLTLICAMGNNTGTGFDPSLTVSDGQRDVPGVTFVRDFYSEEQIHFAPDLIVCRQVLDILADPKAFLQQLRKSIGDRHNTVLYFEVFNAENTFRNNIVWNVIYEHRSWFVPESLASLFRVCGFSILSVKPCWDEEYIGIEIVPSFEMQPVEPNPEACERIESLMDNFVESYISVIAQWKQKLSVIKESRVAAWGAGARGITFLNACDGNTEIPIVDINPNRQGKFLPITGHKVEPPEALLQYRPEVLIITNPTYAEEIKTQAIEMGISSTVMVL